MKLNQSTELMKNQKFAQALKPDTMFKALQTQEGSSLFFSIGPDGAFYISRERQADQLGWARINLSQQLSASYNGAPVTVRTFDVAQDLTQGTIDIIIVATVGGQDYLYISLDNKNSDTNWETASPAFTIVKFDDKNNLNFAGLPISDVYIAQTGSTEFIIADILTDTTTNFVTRYFVDPTAKKAGTNQAWNLHSLAGNLEAGTITSLMGRKGGEAIDGVYTLGSIGHEAEIIYTPMYDRHVVGRIPSSISISLPDGANASNTAMALTTTSAPYTDLFVVANGSLYYLGYSDQVNLAIPAKVYTHPLLNGVTTLHVNQYNGQLVLWGLCKDPSDGVQKVFIMECTAGNETVDSTYDPVGQGWKCPIPIIFNVLNVSTFINNQLSGSVIFAHLSDDEGTLIQLSEDPATSAWHQRSILIPEVVMTKAYDVNTYTTHLEFTDDNQQAQPNVPVAITATHPVSVYVNDIYYTLDPTTPLSINTDGSGVVTIVQEVDSIGAVAYFISAADLQNISVNPLSDIMGKLDGFNTDPNADPDPTKLNVTVTDENGTQSQLVDSSVGDDQKKLAVGGITQFVSSKGDVDSSGKVQDTQAPQMSSGPVAPAASVKPAAAVSISGVSFVKGRQGVYHGAAAMAQMGVKINADGSLSIHPANMSLGSIGSWIESKAGHVLKWMKQEAHKIGDVIKKVEDGVIHFYVTIANEAYHFVVKCLRDLADGIHAMLAAVKTAFDDMVKWLGMIFNFQDIKNTHKVLHNFFSRYIQHINSDVDDLATQVSNAFSTIRTDITNLTGLPPVSDTYGGNMNGAAPISGSKSPSANWGNHHFKSNADGTTDNIAPTGTVTDPTKGLMDKLLANLETSEESFEGTIDQLKTLISNAPGMSAGDVATQVIGILLELIVDGTEAMVLLAVSCLQTMLASVDSPLDTPMQIPVISYLYDKIVGEELTALGLVTFIGAIPVTVIMKIAAGTAPFPSDDPTTQQLIDAQSLSDIQAIFNGSATPAAAKPAATIPAAAGVSPASAAYSLSGYEYHINVGTALQRANLSMNILAGIGVVVMDVILLKSGFSSSLDLLPMTAAETKVNNKFVVVNSAAYFLYASPDVLSSVMATKTDWATKLNTALTTLACIKAGADATTVFWPTIPFAPDSFQLQERYFNNVAPILDFIINTIWLAPPAYVFAEAIESGKWNPNDIVNFVGNMFFDFSGMASLGMMVAKKVQGEARPVGIAAAVWCIASANAIWGVASLMVSFDGFGDPNT